MTTLALSNPHKSHRFRAEIIGRYARVCFRLCLSYRHAEELMAVRGVLLTYEAVRYRCREFRQAYANALRRQRSQLGDKWHWDEVLRLPLRPTRDRHRSTEGLWGRQP